MCIIIKDLLNNFWESFFLIEKKINSRKVTAKKPLFGNARSHALNATRKKQGVNLQKVTINGKSVRVSARELRSLKKMANN